MPRSLVALGSNLGDRRQTLSRAVELLAAQPGTTLLACSGWHETAPIGGPPGQGPFLNGVACLETSLPPTKLHAALRGIEVALARQPTERWAARIIDLDLLLYGDEVIATPELTVPHPRMAFRRFVLEPAVEVAPHWVHPMSGRSLAELLVHLQTARPYVALLGPPASGKRALAESLSAAFGGRFLAELSHESTTSDGRDSTGRVYRRQIQFLDHRSGAIDRRTWPDGQRLAVSDFYLDQGLAYARIELNSEEWIAYAAAWQAVQPDIVQPKLIVVLDQSVNEPPSQRLPAPSDAASNDVARLRSELLTLASRRDLAPVVYVGAADAQAQLAEASAAIQSMN